MNMYQPNTDRLFVMLQRLGKEKEPIASMNVWQVSCQTIMLLHRSVHNFYKIVILCVVWVCNR